MSKPDQRVTDVNLSELFGIDLEIEDTDQAPAVANILCGKCKGRGNFIGYTGRVVGKCFTCSGTGLRPSAGEQADAAINVSAIATAFTAAFSHGIKRPKLRLDTFIFSRAPDHGRNAGSIYVTESGAYLGRVTEGRLYPMRSCDDLTKARVIAVAADPHEAAKAYGLKTGVCGCCGRELTNGESIRLGIGPICRDKFGW